MNIIFLDVDGVLNSSPYFEKIHKDKTPYKQLSEFYLKNLSQIYHKCNAKIVLSSTWRKRPFEDKDYQYLVKSLEKYGMEIYSKTPVIDNKRPLEIKSRLIENKVWHSSQLHKQDINFVILEDDYEDGYKKHNLDKNLVKTSFFGDSIDKCGLNEDATNLAIKILTCGSKVK